MNNISAHTPTELVLDWHKLQHFTELPKLDERHEKGTRSGVYIWGFLNDTAHDARFWPYYVGKHRNVPFRLCEHLSNLKGGNYTSFTEQSLFLPDREVFYSPKRLADRILFIRDCCLPDQAVHIRNMIDRFYFTCCLFDNYKLYGADAEKTVLNCFSKKILGNTRTGLPTKVIDVGNLFDVIDPCWDMRNKELAGEAN